MKIWRRVKMRSKTNGHYYADIQFIGRDIRVNVRQVKFDQSIDGISGSGWIASVDDKPLSNMFDFKSTRSHKKKDCIKVLKQILARAYSRKMRNEFKIHLGDIDDDTLFDATYSETEVGALKQ